MKCSSPGLSEVVLLWRVEAQDPAQDAQAESEVLHMSGQQAFDEEVSRAAEAWGQSLGPLDLCAPL